MGTSDSVRDLLLKGSLKYPDHGSAKPPEYYDDLLRRCWSDYSGPLYRKRARWLVRRLRCYGVRRIFEVAGAVGFLADRIVRKVDLDAYYWSEFSPYAVERVRKQLSFSPVVQAFIFDIDKDDPAPWMSKIDCFISTGLDHVNFDREIVRRILPGTLTVLGIPNSPNESHVRHVETMQQLIDRYSDLIDVIEYKSFTVRGTVRWVLVTALVFTVKKVLRFCHLLKLFQWLSGYKHFMKEHDRNPFANDPPPSTGFVVIGRRRAEA